MSTTITYLPDMRTTPTPETLLERGLFTYDAKQGFRGPPDYMEKRGCFVLQSYAPTFLRGVVPSDDVLRDLARDYADMTATYTPETPLKVGAFGYDGVGVSGPGPYMEARGTALLEAQWGDVGNGVWCMRDALEDLRHDYLACKRRCLRAVRANKPIPDDLRFLVRTETRESA